jgi:hypothetical protein
MQAMINIGVVTGALPNKGLPLPFISRGGSNLMILLGSIGVLLSIARHAKVREDLSTPATKESRRGSNPFAPPERERPAANARQRQSWGWRAWFLPNSRNPESSGLSRA